MGNPLVWAHWTDTPTGSTPQKAPVPASLAKYGTPPTVSYPTPASPSTVWCELASQADINSANWGGPGWVGGPGGHESLTGDTGYSSSAVDFSVTEVVLGFETGGLNMPGGVTFTLYDPHGNLAGVVTPTQGSTTVYPVSVNVPSGKGIWTVAISQAPQLYLGPAPVEEPYVSVYVSGDIFLGLEFVGTEVTCPDAVTSSASVATDCVNGTRQVTLCVNLTQGGAPFLAPAGTWVEWNFGDGQTGNTQVSTPASSFCITHPYSDGTWTPSITLLNGSQCGPFELDPVIVAPCLPCPTTVTVALVPPGVTGCAPGGNPAASFQATVTWPSTGGPFPSPVGYVWEVTVPSAKTASKSTATNTTDLTAGWTGAGATSAGAVDLTSSGQYSIAVSVQFAADSGVSATCNLLGSVPFVIPACTACATIESLVATVTGCVGPDSSASVTFTVTLTGPPVTSVQWTVTNPSGTAFTKSTLGLTTTSGVADGPWLNTTTGSRGPLDLSTAGAYAAAVSASGPTISPNCPPSAPAGFTVPQCSPATSGGGTTGAKLGCAILLVVAIILLLAGGITADVGACIPNPYVVAIGAIVAAVGLVLFALWAFLCARFTACGTMQSIQCLIWWIISVVSPIVVAVLAVLAYFGIETWACAGASLATWGGWAAIYGWLTSIMVSVHCGIKKCR